MQDQLKAMQIKGNKVIVFIATNTGMYSSTISRSYFDCSVYINCLVNFQANGWIITQVSLAE